MDILVIGGGGREHAICWSLKRSKQCGKLYCMPGNAGISEVAECVNIGVMEFDKILDFLNKNQNIKLTVVAPDDPLASGLVDLLEKNGHRAFGPHANAAIIEGSKAFSKQLMKKYNIPTANYEEFVNYDKAIKYLDNCNFPLVVKADGLALGKGVIICQNRVEAEVAIKEMLIENKFAQAGNKIIIEEFLKGKEVSILAFTDGKTIYPMVSSQDHKRALDNDEGLNTGGMGTFSPSKFYTPQMAKRVFAEVIIPTIKAMENEGRLFKGVLYFGLMIDGDDIKVLEYNARFGDPETQVVLPRLKTDLIDIFEAIIDGTLDKINVEWEDNCCVCVILA
ncbi:MAG: phosphoribosylamine--glycine ligase, partial [Clostridia bacterium]